MPEMDQGVQVCKTFDGAKRQKVKDEETLGSSLEDEATGVEHLLEEPKTVNLLVDDILCFEELTSGSLSIDLLSVDLVVSIVHGGMEFTNPIGHHNFGFGVLDGLLDEVEEVDDILAGNDISGACGDFLLDFELAEKSPNLYFVQSERTQLDTSSLESQSPGVSGSDSGALGLSESSTLTVLASDYKNWSLEKTVKRDFPVSYDRSECQELIEDGLLFTHDLGDLEEVHADLKPSGLFFLENERKPVHAITGKRTRRPTKRYIEELSAPKTKGVKMSQNDNGTVDSLSHRTAYNASKEDSCCEGGVTQSFENLEVSLDEKLWGIVKTRNFSSNGSKEKHLKLKCQDELHHTTDVKPESREESCTRNDVQGPSQRWRGRPKKSAAQIHKSEHEWTGSDSEDDCVKRRTYKRRKSTCYDDRRKHQRSWTLSEVVKLVDGVAKYGTGRWTDIKNYKFSSSSYRTPVDLRDKWRNLLRASSSCKAMSAQEDEVKQGFKGIPLAVLQRVGELATVHPYPRFSPGGSYVRRKN